MIKKTILITFFVVFSLNINKLQAWPKPDCRISVTDIYCECYSSPYIDRKEEWNKNKYGCTNGLFNKNVPTKRWYSHFNSHNIVWHKHKISPDEKYSDKPKSKYQPAASCVTNRTIHVENCISDTYMENKIKEWYGLYAYSFADLLGEEMADPEGSIKDRANRIVGIRKRAVAKIRSLAKEVGHGVNEGVLGSDDYSGISNELKRFIALKNEKNQSEKDNIKAEKDRQHKEELNRLALEREKARLTAERLEKAERDYEETKKELKVALSETKKREEQLKSNEETIKILERNAETRDKKFEEYKRRQEEEEERKKILEERRERLYEFFYDFFNQESYIDQGMVVIFERVFELSEEFREIFENLKEVHKVRRFFKEKASQLEDLLWNIINQHKDLKELIDQPIEYSAIEYSDNGLFALSYKTDEDEL